MESSRTSCRRGASELRMAVAVPRALRRLRPALVHFQYALPPAAPSAGGGHGPRPLVRARRVGDGPDRPDHVPRRRAAGGASRGARAHRVAANEGRPRSPLPRQGGEDRRHAERRRPGVRAGARRRRQRRVRPLRRRDPGAEGPARRARGRRGGGPAARRRRAREGPRARAGAAGARRRPARLRDARRARRPVSGRRRARAAVPLRGVRAAGARGDGVRDAGGGDRGPGAARGRRRCRRVRRPRGPRRGASPRAHRAGTARRRGPRACADASRGPRRQSAPLDVYREVLAR